MKKVFSLVLVALVLNSFVFLPQAEAKPAWCSKALKGCVEICGGNEWGLLCSTGCGIGYLFCG